MDGSENRNPLLQEIEFGAGGVLLGLAAFLLVLFALNYFNIITLSAIFPGLSFLPHRSLPKTTQPPIVPKPTAPFSTPPDNLQSCAVTKVGNPLVAQVQTIQIQGKNTIIGDFRGNINKVDFEKTKNSATLEVISPKGEQKHTFTVVEEAGLVHDLKDGQDKPLSSLAAGEVVTMSFNCFPDKPATEQFKITRITITSRL